MEQLQLVPSMTPEEDRIAKIIFKHRGRSNPVQVTVLSYKTGIDQRKVREIVKGLIEDHLLPIGSTSSKPAGYYVITDPRELRLVRRSLIRRAVSILNRAKAYDRGGWVSEMAGQLTMRLEADRDPEQSQL
ncbi:MAG: hypothetical protein U1D96_05295 [Eubacteriales bacterium]|nr:hypothetical protein [Eubacteriales bacterium]